MTWLPLAYPVLCLLAWLATQRRIYIAPVVRVLPVDVFQDDAARVRFWKTEPLIIRRTKMVKNTVRWIVFGFIGEILCFILPRIHINFG